MTQHINATSEDEVWKNHVIERCKELEPLVFGKDEPSEEIARVYFKFHKILNDVFYIGADYSQHPRNPWYKFSQKKLDNEKNLTNNSDMDKERIIAFLQEKIQEISPRVFADNEPSLTDRMTLFAYANLLFKRYGLGTDLSKHPRNPWLNREIPLDFMHHKQIRQLPDDTKLVENPNKKTQIIAVPDVLPPKPEKLFRVYDIDKPDRTVYQNTESACYRYANKANHDMGYKGFDWADTGTMFVPREKGEPKIFQTPTHERKTINYPRNSGGGGCCPVNQNASYQKPQVKSKVQEYLERCKKEAEKTETKAE